MVVGENGDLEFEEAQKADPHEVLDDIGGIQVLSKLSHYQELNCANLCVVKV